MTGGTHPYDDLKAYCDGELTLTRRLSVRLHLTRCAFCREEIQFMREFEIDLRADSGTMPLDPALRARVLAEAATIPRTALTPPARTHLRLAPIYAVASLGIVMALAAVIERPWTFRTVHQPAKDVAGVRIAQNPAPSRDAGDKDGFAVDGSPFESIGHLPPAPLAETDRRGQTNRQASNDVNSAQRHSKATDVPSYSAGAIRTALRPESVASAPPLSVPDVQIAAGTPTRAAAELPSPVSPAPAYAMPTPSAPQMPPPPSVPEAKAEVNHPLEGRDSSGSSTVNGSNDGGLDAIGVIAAKSAFDSGHLWHSDRQAMLTLQVADPEARSSTVAQIARDLGGVAKSDILSVSQSGLRSETLVFDVPDAQLESFMNIVSTFGVVTFKQSMSEDVTKNNDQSHVQSFLDNKAQKATDAETPHDNSTASDKIEPSNDLTIPHDRQTAASATVTVILTEKTEPSALKKTPSHAP